MRKINIIIIAILFVLCIAVSSNPIFVHAAVIDTKQTSDWLLCMTSPFAVTLLLCMASIGIVLQVFSPHFGFGGILSILALSFFYMTHMIAGYATWQGILLLVLGVLLLLLELIVPGGILGIMGFAAIIVSLLSSGTDTMHMAYAILTALIVAVLGMVIMMKFFGKKLNIFNKMVLNDSTDTEKGYVSNKNRVELLGQEAITTTPLRPSGTAMLGEERIDVVTEGGYIDAHKKVTIIKVEGVRIVVRESHNV